MSTEHIWVQEHIETFVTGGLTASERARLESHVAACADCNAAMTEVTDTDQEMKRLFAEAQPKPGFEDAIIQRLRTAPRDRFQLNSRIWRVGLSLAAVVLVGLLGYVMSEQVLSGESRPLVAGTVSPSAPATERSEFSNDLGVGWRPSTSSASEIASERSKNYLAKASPRKEEKLRKPSEKAGADEPKNYRNQSRVDDPAVYEAREKDRNESADNDFKLHKGNGLDMVSDKPFRGIGTYDTIGKGGAGGGRFDGKEELGRPRSSYAPDSPASKPYDPARPPAPEADEPPADAQQAQQKGASGERGYSYRDELTKGGEKQAEAKYFKPGELARAEKPESKAKVMTRMESVKKALEKENALRESTDDEKKAEEKLPPAQQQPAEPPKPVVQRKIIRNGEMEFEIESFDAAFDRIQKIAAEESGFIATTSSEKLPNGKVRGSITVRVPPDNLDRLVQKLRALGELKGQKITAQDITKHYTDLESALRAARAMEERLINIIKNGGSDIKALVEAEKQLGVYRERIEQLEGEIRYYNSLISLSTLIITLYEKDIKTPFSAKEIETVGMGIETDDVEKAYSDALKEINDRKARVTRAELKKYDAGQYSAQISFEITPLTKDNQDQVGPLIDRFKQLGRVSRLDRDRTQTTEGGSGRPQGIPIERKDTVFNISIYNLANISPRETAHMNIACGDVEETYKAILARIEKAGGRVVASNLNRQKPEQTTGAVNFEIKSAEAGAVEVDVRAMGEIMRFTVIENPDQQNVTKAKRGFSVSLYHIATVAPHETVTMNLACTDVEASYKAILDRIAKANGRVINSNLNRVKADKTTATIYFEIKAAETDAVDKDVRNEGEVISKKTDEYPEAHNATKAKKRFNVVLYAMGLVSARETTTLKLATRNVPETYRTLLGAVQESKGRVMTSRLDEQDKHNVSGVLEFEVRREELEKIDKTLSQLGDTFSRNVSRATETENAVDTKVRFYIDLLNAERLAPREETEMAIEVPDVDRAFNDIRTLAMSNSGREIEANLSRERTGRIVGRLIVDVPLTNRLIVQTALKAIEGGIVRVEESSKNPHVPEGTLARARFKVVFSNAEMIVAPDEGVGSTLRKGWSTSVKGLLLSLQFVVIGLFLVVPAGLLVWAGWLIFRRKRTRPVETPAVK